MKLLLYFTSIAVSILTPAICTAQSPTPRTALSYFSKLRDGDLVFIKSSTSRAEPIEKLTRSPLTHCGIIFLDGNGKPVVYEGAGRNEPRYATVEKWQIDESTKKGAASPDSPLHAVYARRLKTPLTKVELDDLKKRAAELHATKYDHAFQLGNKEPGSNKPYVYCSELIYEAFQKIGRKVGEPRPFRYYYKQPDLTEKQVKELMDPLLDKESAQELRTPKGKYNPDEAVISPEDVYISELLQDVTD